MCLREASVAKHGSVRDTDVFDIDSGSHLPRRKLEVKTLSLHIR